MIVKVVIPDAIYARVYFARGEQGPIGATGATGVQGPTGATGATGATGTSYTPGDPIYVTVRNATGSTMLKGTIVYTSGGNGTHTQVSPALATGDSTSARVLGWLSESIANNASGLCQVEGYLDGIDTQGIAEGTQLYVSGTTAGAFQTTKPVAPIHLVYAGVVVKASAGNGRVYVKVQNGYELDEIHDVLIASPANNEVLTYETSTGLWKNKSNPADGVTSITATSPLTGGTITSTGSIGIDQTLLTVTESQVTNLVSDLAAKAPTASPTFTGTVTTPVTSGSILYTDASGVLGKVGNAPNVGFIPYTAAVTGGMSWQSLGLLAKTNAANAFTVGGHTIANDAIGTVPLSVKAIASQTANLQTWTDSASAVLAQVTAGGSIASGANGTFGSLTSLARLTVVNGTASVIGAVIRGAASQSADLTQWQNSAGSILSRIKSDGTPTFSYGTFFGQQTLSADGDAVKPLVVKGFSATQSGNLQEWQNSAGTARAYVTPLGDSSFGSLGLGYAAPYSGVSNSILGILTAGAANIGIAVRGSNSQTANLTEWQNSAGTILSRVASDGRIYGTTITTLNGGLNGSESGGAGFLRFTRSTSAPANPGANLAFIYFRDGTTAGTLKLVVRAGAAGAETTILDNIPQ